MINVSTFTAKGVWTSHHWRSYGKGEEQEEARTRDLGIKEHHKGRKA